jgi:hypothetical protein
MHTQALTGRPRSSVLAKAAPALAQARMDLEALEQSGAPPRVIDAGRMTVRCVEQGVSPPAHLHRVLMDYCRKHRQEQNRWGQ